MNFADLIVIPPETAVLRKDGSTAVISGHAMRDGGVLIVHEGAVRHDIQSSELTYVNGWLVEDGLHSCSVDLFGRAWQKAFLATGLHEALVGKLVEAIGDWYQQRHTGPRIEPAEYGELVSRVQRIVLSTTVLWPMLYEGPSYHRLMLKDVKHAGSCHELTKTSKVLLPTPSAHLMHYRGFGAPQRLGLLCEELEGRGFPKRFGLFAGSKYLALEFADREYVYVTEVRSVRKLENVSVREVDNG